MIQYLIYVIIFLDRPFPLLSKSSIQNVNIEIALPTKNMMKMNRNSVMVMLVSDFALSPMTGCTSAAIFMIRLVRAS